MHFVLRRSLSIIPTLIIATTVVFFSVWLLPADAATVQAGLDTTPQTLAFLRHKMGLDVPIHVMYFKWLYGILTGNLGVSTSTGEPVLTILMQRLPNTLLLTVLSIVFATAVGIPVGIAAAVHKNKIIDRLGMTFSFMAFSMPEFWTALILITVFAVHLGWFPTSALSLTDPWSNPSVTLWTLFLPAVALSAYFAGEIARFTRSSMLEVIGSDFILTTRAKGLSERLVLYKHGFKNAAIPVLTEVSFAFGWLLGGTVVIETIFNYPGMGQLFLFSALRRDIFIIQGFALVYVLIFILTNLATDILYARLDPRVRHV